MKKRTREWVRKGEKDYHAAVRLAAATEPFHDQVCFFCQQSAEKHLKALLVESGKSVPRTHNLDGLLALLRPYHPSLGSLRRGLIFLTDFAVDVRYPPVRTMKRQAVAALRWAGKVRDACRTLLKL